MEGVNSSLDKHITELLDPSTTPEKALQSFSSFCFSTDAYFTYYAIDNEHYVVFLAHVKFIMSRLTDACVHGIWEDILKKTVLYCRMYRNVDLVRSGLHGPISLTEVQAASWLNEALSSTSKCPNPYVRLELFRLIRIFLDTSRCLTWERICITFIQTIGEIQPHRLYASANVDWMPFGICDMQYIIIRCCLDGKSKNMISCNFLVGNNKETNFITQTLKLITVFALMAGSITVPDDFIKKGRVIESYMKQIRACSDLLKFIGSMVAFLGPKVRNKSWKYPYHSIVCRLPFHHYLTEAICDLSSAINKNKVCKRSTILNMIEHNSTIARELGVSTKTCDLPRILLYRQMQGSTKFVSQYSLLLRNISPFSYEDSDGNVRGNEN
ncbi:unnamed protein product [Meganyctiphanes norvegica]|uniref:Uncharacterized protein n=1 Tax=Meganyctiphanes norvegica TaxID=48144 RepID=A0AAV2QI96_MEGNR